MKIAEDKLQHMVGGAIIAAIVLGVGYYNHVDFTMYAIIASLAVGLAKEYIYDAAHPATHTVDIYDAVATFAGGLIAVAVYVLVRGGA